MRSYRNWWVTPPQRCWCGHRLDMDMVDGEQHWVCSRHGLRVVGLSEEHRGQREWHYYRLVYAGETVKPSDQLTLF